jgi:hypothetical protein
MKLTGTGSFIAPTSSFSYLSGSFTHVGSAYRIGNTILVGDQQTTGSLNISGSTIMIGNNSMTGNTQLTGSVGISGSTIQLGNNTLAGNTVLSGSINIIGNSSLTGSFLVSGSTTQIGNNTLTGNTILSGSVNISGSSILSGSLTLSSGSALSINDGFYVNGNKQFNYGTFYDTTIQSGSANTAYSMRLNTTDFAVGVSIVSGSQITVSNTGIYNLQFSAQLLQTATGASDISIWLKKNGTNVVESNGDITIERTAGGGKQIAAWNYLIQLNANQYVELMWSSTSANTQIHYTETQSTPTRPSTPSLIVTLTQIA